MKPGGTIDRAFSKIIDTPLYWPVKTIRSLLNRLTEAREEWTDRPASLRLRLFVERCWLFVCGQIVRVSTGSVEPGMNNLRRMPPDPDIPEYERRMASYSSVMATLRSYACNTRYQFDWSHPHGGNNEGVLLLLSLEAVGVDWSSLDESTPQWALSLSRSHSGVRPAVRFSPRSTRDGTLGYELSHELFHMASPLETRTETPILPKPSFS